MAPPAHLPLSPLTRLLSPSYIHTYMASFADICSYCTCYCYYCHIASAAVVIIIISVVVSPVVVVLGGRGAVDLLTLWLTD